MKYNTKLVLICTGSLLCTAHKTLSSPRIWNFFSKHTQTPQHTMTKEYSLNHPGSITVINPYGSIKIKKEWPEDKIVLSTITTVKTLEQTPPTVHIDQQHTIQGDLTFTVACLNPDKKTSIDVELIVPEKRELKLDTLGAIHIENIQAAISANSTQGTITLDSTRGTIIAKTENKGSITINRPQGNIKATTDKGALFLYDTPESVIASSNKGTIHLTCKKLPSTGKLTLQTISGKIVVRLPDEVNADLVAKTKHGAIICDHIITIKPFPTLWNKEVWRRLKHEICGTLGTGEALITIQNYRGNIKIGKYA